MKVYVKKLPMKAIKAAYENVLGRPEDVAGLQFYQDQVLNQGLDPTQIDDIFADSPEAQVRKDAEEFLRRLEAGEDVTGIGVPLDASQFTTPITQKIAADLIGRAQTGGVLTSEFDQYGGYDAVKNVYDASGGAGPGVVTDDTVVDGVETIDLPTRTTPPNVDTTNLFTSTGDTRAVTGPPVPDYGYINDLYKTYFGRDASFGELASYAGIFGPTIEPNEIKDFILGGVTSKEITQDQADILLGLKPDPVKIAAETEAANAEGRPGAGQILGIPSANANQPGSIGGSGPGGDGFSDGFGDPSPSSGGSVGGTSVSGPAGATSDSNAADDAAAAAAAAASVGATSDSNAADDAAASEASSPRKTGGLIRMAEGGEPPTPPPMSKLSP
jgi:hypothetical protein